MTTTSVALAAPYTKKIGKVTFQVSSFANPEGTESAQQMLLHLMEHRLLQEPSERREQEKNDSP